MSGEDWAFLLVCLLGISGMVFMVWAVLWLEMTGVSLADDADREENDDTPRD